MRLAILLVGVSNGRYGSVRVLRFSVRWVTMSLDNSKFRELALASSTEKKE